MNDDELAGDDFRSSFVLNAGLAALTMGGSAAFQGTALAARFPWLAKSLQFLDASKGRTLAGKAARFSLGQAVDEVPSTYLDDNTGGSAVQLLKMMGIDSDWVDGIDPVNPGMSRTEASNAALGPKPMPLLAFSLVRCRVVPGCCRRRVVQSAPGGRRHDEKRHASGKWKPRKLRIPVEWPAIPEMTAADRPTGWTMGELEADLQRRVEEEGKLESDAVEEVIDGNMDDAELDEVIARQEAGEDTVEIVEEITARQSDAPLQDGITLETTAAPSSNLAGQNIPIEQRFSSVSVNALRSLAANSPKLAERITYLTGRSGPGWDKTDVLQGIRSLEMEGNTVMPTRLMGQPVLPVDQIEVAPDRFQFKQGTDAEGQQKGNSLSGVGVWNEGMEGNIQVWEDPADGKTYVVNGHNRLAKAKSLGVPSMKVEYLNAGSAEEARALGALNNIAQGGGTLFDAAKFMRDSGIKDPQELESLGVPMKSGLAADGLALASCRTTSSKTLLMVV